MVQVDNEKLDKLKLFDAKQMVLGKLFDFKVGKNCIEIVKYYDIPNREIVVIPDFVDTLNEALFSECKYVAKVIANSNIRGSIRYLFYNFKGTSLELDFDTSNIRIMDSMFGWCGTKSIDLGKRFDMSNVKSMACMFLNCSADSINLGDLFDTSRVEDTKSVFAGCDAQVMYLGHQYKANDMGKLL